MSTTLTDDEVERLYRAIDALRGALQYIHPPTPGHRLSKTTDRIIDLAFGVLPEMAAILNHEHIIHDRIGQLIGLLIEKEYR